MLLFGENDRSKIYSYNMRTKEWGEIFSIPLDGQDLFFYVTGVDVYKRQSCTYLLRDKTGLRTYFNEDGVVVLQKDAHDLSLIHI